MVGSSVLQQISSNGRHPRWSVMA